MPVEFNPKLIIGLGLGVVLVVIAAAFWTAQQLSTNLPAIAQASATPTLLPATSTATPSATPSPTSTPTTSPTAYPTLGSAATATPTPTPLFLISQGDTLPEPTAPPPTATPFGRIACTVSAAALQLREGPGPGYEIIDTLPSGAAVAAFKCAPNSAWILVETAQQEIGWINSAFATCQGDLAQLPLAAGVVSPPPTVAATVPVPTPTVIPSETALPPVDSWRGEYFDNPHLAGEPAQVRFDPNLEFNWILDSPAPTVVPADNFSARWTRRFDFGDGGDFRFFAEVDDGIKIYVDGRVVLDDWHNFAPVTYQADMRGLSPGLHTVTVEYFESGGYARIKVWGESTRLEDQQWQAEYYPNSDLQPPAALTRQDDEIDFDWGHGAPASGLNADKFSVRWQRTIYFHESGDYKFLAKLADDDRVKIYLDGWLVVDKYKERSGTAEGIFARLAPGFHTVIVEYVEEGDRARIKVWWERQ